MSLIIKRLAAWCIDWIIILLYAAVLFAIVMILDRTGVIAIKPLHPIEGQLVGFFTLTLPVLVYCVLMEHFAQATIGKRLMRLHVSASGFNSTLLRNACKFLPWEIAHAGILWINYVDAVQTPLWIWLLLIVPQFIVVVYVIVVVRTKGRMSVYDRLAGTEVVQN